MSTRTASWLAWPIFGFCVILTALGLILEIMNSSASNYLGSTIYLGAMIIALLFPLVGALIVSRQPENAIGWIFCAMGLSEAIAGLAGPYAVYTLFTGPEAFPGGAVMSWVAFWSWLPGFSLIPFLLLLFPSGRPPSRRWRWVGWLAAFGTGLGTLNEAIFTWPLKGPYLVEHMVESAELGDGATYSVLSIISGLLLMVSLLGAASSLMVRFRQAHGVERQQLKWFTYSATIAALVELGNIELNPYGGNLGGNLTNVIGVSLQVLFFAGIPVAVGIAILRYGLYEIDLIINKTLVYGVLTVSLALTYIGGVISLEYLLRLFTGHESNLAIVASTLAIAALFNPLRRRIQSFVDRRFYRRKYDAAKTLEAFSVRLRDETDLKRISDDLVGLVHETIRPAHISVWLTPGASRPSSKEDQSQHDLQNTAHES